MSQFWRSLLSPYLGLIDLMKCKEETLKSKQNFLLMTGQLMMPIVGNGAPNAPSFVPSCGSAADRLYDVMHRRAAPQCVSASPFLNQPTQQGAAAGLLARTRSTECHCKLCLSGQFCGVST